MRTINEATRLFIIFDTANVKRAQYLRQNNDDTILTCRMVNLSRHIAMILLITAKLIYTRIWFLIEKKIILEIKSVMKGVQLN